MARTKKAKFPKKQSRVKKVRAPKLSKAASRDAKRPVTYTDLVTVLDYLTELGRMLDMRLKEIGAGLAEISDELRAASGDFEPLEEVTAGDGAPQVPAGPADEDSGRQSV